MASITITGLSERTIQALHSRAAEAGSSLETVARDVLVRAARAPRSAAPPDLFTLSRRFFGRGHGIDLTPGPRSSKRRIPLFED